MRNCPVCQSANVVTTITRPNLPIFQNVVWSSREEALDAPTASFALGTCVQCGFSFNVEFDAARMIYDERYDNNVPSEAFRVYYQSLADMLASRFDLTSGSVYDVGCGKGEFLKILCATAPGVRGIGIDPSCTPIESGNFQLIRDLLKPSHFAPDTRLVVVRHVLEHIDDPVAFMEMLRGCVPDVPVFVEVPDLDWILKNAAFWDFCYEHCNYFTLPSLSSCLSRAGFSVIEQQRTFGDQYQWALCVPSDTAAPASAGDRALGDVQAYAENEATQIGKLRDLARSSGGVAIWGMATKGVILSSILGAENVVGGIDGNPGKQGRYAAGSAVRINPPEWVRSLPADTTVLVMNPNYRDEIEASVQALGAAVRLENA